MKTPKLCKPNREITENTTCLIYGYETPQQKCEAAGGNWDYDTVRVEGVNYCDGDPGDCCVNG